MCTLRERQPSPTGVSSGPFRTTLYCIIASSVSFGKRVPFSFSASHPAKTFLQLIFLDDPYALSTALSTTHSSTCNLRTDTITLNIQDDGSVGGAPYSSVNHYFLAVYIHFTSKTKRATQT